MADIYIDIGDDYPLKGVVTNFEAYMFATKDKFIQEHTSFDEEIILVDGNRSVQVFSMKSQSDRLNALTVFNKLAKLQISTMPSANGLSCVLIDLSMDEDDWDFDEIQMVYNELKDVFIQWMKQNNRVAVMVQHFYQGKRYPHVHILYQKAFRKHNEFKDYLNQIWHLTD